MQNLRLPSQPQNVTVNWPLANYTAFLKNHKYVNNLGHKGANNLGQKGVNNLGHKGANNLGQKGVNALDHKSVNNLFRVVRQLCLNRQSNPWRPLDNKTPSNIQRINQKS